MNKLSLTTVTPVYRGKDYLADLVAKIEEIRNKWSAEKAPVELIEAIFVNDASIDGSQDLLVSLEQQKEWITAIDLSKNYGQHQATIAGILHSSGDWVVTLDEDMQHDPLLIDILLETAVESRADIVYATAEEKVHNSLLRDYSSKLFKKTVSVVTGNQHVQKFSSFRLIRGPIARASSSICSHGTYFDIALCWFTDRVTSVNLPLKDLRFIEEKTSGYTFRKLLSHARSMVVSSETKMVRLGASVGLLSMIISLLVILQITFQKLFSPDSIPVQGWTSLFLVSLFFGGLLAFMVGIALEYISVILLHIQGKPTFFTIDRFSDQILTAFYKSRETDATFPAPSARGK